MNDDGLRRISAEVRDYILAEFLPGTAPDELDESTRLITGGILDSLSTVRLVSYLENRYGIEFKAHEMDVDHLDTLARVAETVRAKLAK